MVLIDYGTDHPFFLVPIPISKNMAASILASGAVIPSIVPPSNPNVSTLYMTLSIFTRKQTNAYDIAYAAGGNVSPGIPKSYPDKGGIQLPHYHPYDQDHAHALFRIYNKKEAFMLKKDEIRNQLKIKFNPRLASVSDLNSILGDRYKKNSVYNHEHKDLIDITEGAIYNTWKEHVDRYDIFIFDSKESKIIDDYEYGENDGYTCNFLVVEYDEHDVITQYFIWNGYSNITKELLEILKQVK